MRFLPNITALALALGRSKGRIVPIDTVSGTVDGRLNVRDNGIISLVKHVYGTSLPDSLRDVGSVTIVNSGEYISLSRHFCLP